MKKKAIVILLTVLVLVLLGWKFFFTPSSERQVAAIEWVFEVDEGLWPHMKLSDFWNVWVDEDMTKEKVCLRYISHLKNIPVKNCPWRFRRAFKKHIAAWEDRDSDAIKNTWREVVYIASDYGVVYDK